MEDCGHIPPEELPKESLEIVLEFLKENGEDPSPRTPYKSAPAKADT
jgi:hypothetical protein